MQFERYTARTVQEQRPFVCQLKSSNLLSDSVRLAPIYSASFYMAKPALEDWAFSTQSVSRFDAVQGSIVDVFARTRE